MNKGVSLVRNRILGRFDGEERGPLLLAIGGMHGNEPAGVLAIERLLEMLAFERVNRPEFMYRGRFVGLIGNKQALSKGRRFLREDLNRFFNPERVAALNPADDLIEEDAEAYELINAIRTEIADYQPSHVVLIDLHTTTADGGVFSIVNDSPAARAIALDLRAPVILGMLEGISGTSLHYFNTKNLGTEAVCLVFESGQHDDPLSVDRAVSALIKTMRSIGAVHPRDVEGHHDEILRASTEHLPDLVRFALNHGISPADQFVMRPGYLNFDPIKKGEHLADDINGPVLSPRDGLILMPLYQKQGDDGFFVVDEL
ncbi:MAG: succinylglutamate desuccinylase/aspartoacylase family protein [Saprospiraceae bacterium]